MLMLILYVFKDSKKTSQQEEVELPESFSQVSQICSHYFQHSDHESSLM